jgi:hypothetical protein
MTKNSTNRPCKELLYEIGNLVLVTQDGYFRNFYGIIRELRTKTLVDESLQVQYLVDFSKHDNPRIPVPKQVWFHHKKLAFVASRSKRS